MKDILSILQIIIAIFLIIFILLQQKGAFLGSAFGDNTGFYTTQRGIQKKFSLLTIIFGILFILLALINLALSNNL